MGNFENNVWKNQHPLLITILIAWTWMNKDMLHLDLHVVAVLMLLEIYHHTVPHLKALTHSIEHTSRHGLGSTFKQHYTVLKSTILLHERAKRWFHETVAIIVQSSSTYRCCFHNLGCYTTIFFQLPVWHRPNSRAWLPADAAGHPPSARPHYGYHRVSLRPRRDPI